VSEADILAAAAWVRDNLLQHGFDTITIDGGWYDGGDGRYIVDAYGLPMPNETRFPSAAGGKGLLPLATQVRAMGLKLGAWTIRGVTTTAYDADLPIKGSPYTARDVAVVSRATNCSWDSETLGTNAPSAAAAAWYASLAQHYVDNGLDFVKIDCMFNYTWWYEDEVAEFAAAFASRAPGVEISWSPGGDGRFTPAAGAVLAAQAPAWARMYRVTDDFHDTGGVTTLAHHFDSAAFMAPLIGANGSFPDLDMLPFGLQAGDGGGRPPPRANLFSPDEQRLIMTLWAMARAPLVLGAVLPPAADDNLTLSLVSNAAVLDVNARSCRNAPTPVIPVGYPPNVTALYAWTAAAPDGNAVIVALFNLRDTAANVSAASGVRGGCATNLWTGAAEGTSDPISTAVTRELPPRAAGMWRVGGPC